MGKVVLVKAKESATPPEELARRVLKLHNADLPVDVFSIARNYAEVRLVSLPKTIDGLVAHKTRSEEPKIIVNKTSPEARQRFTVAHELGHILIPWHGGISVDAFEATLAGGEPVGSDDETEANKFAAELLLPSKHVRAALRTNSIARAVLELRSKGKVSIAVACLATITQSRKAHLLVVVDGASEVIGSYKTTDTWISRPAVGSTLPDPRRLFPIFKPEILVARASPYEDAQTIYAWTFDVNRMWRNAQRSGDWRSTLATIIQDTAIEPAARAALRASFAGMSGSANNLIQRSALTPKRRFELLLHRAISNETVACMAEHELFPTLLAQRARSLKPRRRPANTSKLVQVA